MAAVFPDPEEGLTLTDNNLDKRQWRFEFDSVATGDTWTSSFGADVPVVAHSWIPSNTTLIGVSQANGVFTFTMSATDSVTLLVWSRG